MSYARTYSHYRKAMHDILESIKAEVGGEVWEENADDYGWHLCIGDGSEAVDVSLILEDAASFGEDEGHAHLGNFDMMAVEHGGRILGQVCPYNYTPDVWVPLTPKHYGELDRRLAMIANADVVSLLRGGTNA